MTADIHLIKREYKIEYGVQKLDKSDNPTTFKNHEDNITILQSEIFLGEL